MAKVVTSVSLDKEAKEKAIELFNDLQLDMSTAVNLFLDQCVRHDGLPFQVTRRAAYGEQIKVPAPPFQLTNDFVLDEFLSEEVENYFQHLCEYGAAPETAKAKMLHAVHFMQACFCVVLKTSSHTPEHFAWEAAIEYVDGIDEDDEPLFNLLGAPTAGIKSYGVDVDVSGTPVRVSLVDAVSSIFARIDAVLAEKELPPLSNCAILSIMERVAGWLDSTAYNVAESCIVSTRKVPNVMLDAIRQSLRTDCWAIANEIHTLNTHRFLSMPTPEYIGAV